MGGVKNYRPLLLQELDVRLPGAHIRRLRLHRHLPEVDMLAEHSHNFGQILYYLSGRGVMTVEDKPYETGPGTVLFLPPHCVHAFRETTGRRPLCLVLDLDWRGSIKHGFSLARLSQSEAGVVRSELSGLLRLPEPDARSCRLVAAARVLQILDVFLCGLGVLPPRPQQTPSFVRKFDRALRQAAGPLPRVNALAAELGYQTDHLNRIFKRATGRTLREYRDAFVLERARRALAQNERVRDACQELGFFDQNYFTRWFKKQTGLAPGAWRGAGEGQAMRSSISRVI